MVSSYFSIHDILLGNERLTVVAKQNAMMLGFLNPQARSTDSDLSKGTKIDLPLWAFAPLFKAESVDITSFPKHYGHKYREKLKAGAVTFNLRSKSVYFYEVGNAICDLIATKGRSRRSVNMAELVAETGKLREVLKNTYVGERLRRILDFAWNSSSQDVSAFTNKLPQLEADLFAAGQAASNSYNYWKSHGSRRITVSATLLKSSAIAKSQQEAKRSAVVATPENNAKRSKV